MRQLAVAFVFISAGAAVAETSPDGVWSALRGEQLSNYLSARAAVEPRINASRFHLYTLDETAFARVSSRVPLERLDLPAGQRPAGTVVTVPMPDGTFARFRCVESPVMENALAARYPEIRTYAGQGLDDPATTIRFGKTPRGVHAQVLSPDGAVYIDRYYDDSAYIVYRKADYLSDERFTCQVDGSSFSSRTTFAGAATRSGSQLRTYRLAMACTGEYGQYHGGTVQDALSAIVTTVNRVTGIYENELAIRFTLVANNDDIVFTNPATDGYTNDDPFMLLTQNQSKLDSVIGNANYDIGHVVGTGGGGLAALGVVCVNGSKDMGKTGLATPEGDVFDVDYVSHEIGHQFDGDHTFNGITDSCDGNRVFSSAYEPGSGSTIQAYAGICGTDNLQSNSDPYFHSHSFDQMFDYAVLDGDCASISVTGNTEPIADAGANHAIPRATPFTLSGIGSDADGDSLTYCWEQRDLGPQAALSAPDDGLIPLFRSVSPTASPSRTFPKWSTILSNSLDDAEKLPQVSRSMQFRLTVRDNRANSGGVATDDVVVEVDATKGPFSVTYPNGGQALGGAVMVTWDVAGTTGAPVNAFLVDIVCSLDGGETFDIMLADDTPNDGAELVNLPNAASANARLMVRADTNIFFDVSDSDFEIVPIILDDVYVDFSYAGLEVGTKEQPFNSLLEAKSAVSDGGTIWVKPGITAETLALDQEVTMRVDGSGSVQFGVTP